MTQNDKDMIKVAQKYIKVENSVVTSLIRIDNYKGCPPFYQYTTAYRVGKENHDLNVNGLSFNEEEAKAKAVFETVERWSLYHIPRATQTYEVNTQNRITKTSCISCATIFGTNSSGCASGLSKESALNRALYELIEQDAFAIFYYNKLTPQKLPLTYFKKINQLLSMLKSFHFKVHLFNISLDIAVPVCLCVLENMTSTKPYFTLGIKAREDWNDAAEGSILESLQSLGSFRHLAKNFEKINSPILRRIKYWFDKKPQSSLNFLFQGKIKHNISSGSELPVFERLREAGINKVYYRQIYKENGIVVVQAAIPELVKLFMNEKAKPDVANHRIFIAPVHFGLLSHSKTNEDLNIVPHPFP